MRGHIVYRQARVSKVMKMHPNLMGPAAVQAALEKAGPLARPNDAILGFALRPRSARRAHPLPMNRMPSNFCFDHSTRFRADFLPLAQDKFSPPCASANCYDNSR